MAIRSNDPALSALHRALSELVDDTHGAAAAVLDEGNGLWCISDNAWSTAADRFYREEIAARPELHLRRGGHLHVVRDALPDHAYAAESFAGIYVLVLWFGASFDPFTARAKLRAALPRIEQLTLSIQPPFGPDGSEGPGNARA